MLKSDTEKMKEVAAAIQPIVAKAYQQAGAAGRPTASFLCKLYSSLRRAGSPLRRNTGRTGMLTHNIPMFFAIGSNFVSHQQYV